MVIAWLAACEEPAPAPIATASAAPDCAGCHPKEGTPWAASRHASSATNPIYRAALTDARPRAWCDSCHAPTGNPDDGVSCAVCHVEDGHVLGPAAVEDSWDHDVVVSPAMSTSAFCGRCHQFAIPVPDAWPVVYTADPLQDTLGEHTRWGGQQTCQDCHDHAARGGHDPDYVRAAVQIAARDDGEDLLVELVTTGIGHEFPTGDPFRRLVIEADGGARATLFRAFEAHDGGWVPGDDTALLPGEPRVVRLRGAAGQGWHVDYRFGDPRFEPQLAAEDVGFRISGRTGP